MLVVELSCCGGQFELRPGYFSWAALVAKQRFIGVANGFLHATR